MDPMVHGASTLQRKMMSWYDVPVPAQRDAIAYVGRPPSALSAGHVGPTVRSVSVPSRAPENKHYNSFM